MVDTHEVKTRLTADSTSLMAGLRNATTGFYAAGGAASRMGTVARSAFSGMAAVVAATAISVRAVSKVMESAVKTTIEFGDTLARTNAILGGTGEDMEALGNHIREVAKVTRFTASEVGEAANALSIAGVTMSEMVDDKALENLVKFAIAGGVDIQTATNIGIAGVKAFGMEMSELGYVSDVLTRTFTRSNVDIVSLGEGMKFLAPVAKSAGISIEEAAAAVGALGNAGLRGTIAGTGMRMAINKLLKPTHDAMRAMRDLGLNVRTLTPEGKAAEMSLFGVTMQLDRAKAASASLTTEMKALNGQMSDLSIEQQANTLAIEQIRARAARSHRELTQQEEQTIERLTKQNEALRLSEMELDLQRSRTQRTLDQVNEEERTLSATSKDLLRTVEQQTTGITSLGDVLDQLSAAGATTTQVLEIFGVRGGTAVAALLTQRDAFHALVNENENAAGATDQYVKSLQNVEAGTASAKEILFLFKSALEDALIEIGGPLVLILTSLSDVMKGPISTALKDNADLFAVLGGEIASAAAIMVPLAVSMIPDIIHIMRALVPVLVVVAVAFKGVIFVLGSVAQLVMGLIRLFVGLLKVILAVVQALLKLAGIRQKGGMGMLRSAKGDFMQGGKDTLIGGAKTFAAFGTGGVGGMAGGLATGTMMGAGAGAALGAGVASGAVGMAQFADGGFVGRPTPALVGEAGPEVVIPLGAGKEGRRDQLAAQAGLGGITIGDIVINGGSDPQTTAALVRTVVERDLPAAIRRELTRGARGVI